MTCPMDSTTLDIRQKPVQECCNTGAKALLMLPESRQFLNLRFRDIAGNCLTLDQTDETVSVIPDGEIGCLHFRSEKASRVLLCRVLGSSECRQIAVEVLSTAISRDSRSDFRVRVRDHSQLNLKITHDVTGTTASRIRDISQTGMRVQLNRLTTRLWQIGDTVTVSLKLLDMSCRVEARVRRLGALVGLQFPGIHEESNSESANLRSIVSELERRYLRTRIRI